MWLERQTQEGAGPYERSPERRYYANGYTPETVATRVEIITFNVPQVRASAYMVAYLSYTLLGVVYWLYLSDFLRGWNQKTG